MNKTNRKEKLQALSEQYDMSVDEMCEQATFDSIAPSICMNDDCDYTTDMEPDQSKGWCEICGTNTVVSVLCLLDIM